MIAIHPFKAWRPAPEQVEQIACVPYDVIDTEEARVLAEGRPDSFLHVIRPEIDLPADTDLYSDIVYETGAVNLKKMCQSGILIQDPEPRLYLYQQQMGDHIQTGLFTCVSVRDYDENRILKHELTRPDKEDDRTRHILTQQAHAEPVMLTYVPSDRVSALTRQILETEEPVYDFEATDGVKHRVWVIGDPAPFVDAFREIPKLYVADGHHRCKSASRAAGALRNGDYGNDEFEFFPAVVIPMDQMQILAYNRVIKAVPDDFLTRLKSRFDVRERVEPVPSRKGSICLYYQDVWYGLDLPDEQGDQAVALEPDPGSTSKPGSHARDGGQVGDSGTAPDGDRGIDGATAHDDSRGTGEDVAGRLDVSRLHRHILRPLLGIENQRTDPNLVFVGGIRGTRELKQRVDQGRAQLGISMYPTSIAELMAVSDNDQLMPPKSTWFEPKLRSGLLIHTF